MLPVELPCLCDPIMSLFCPSIDAFGELFVLKFISCLLFDVIGMNAAF